MEGKARAKPTSPPVDSRDRHLQRRRTRGGPVCPIPTDFRAESVEKIEPVPLSEQQTYGEHRCGGETDRDRDLDPRIRRQLDQPNKRERRERDLREKLKRDVDDRAGRGRGAGNARQHDRSGS